MTERYILEKAWLANPFVYRNMRGTAKIGKAFVRFGIPEPLGNESDEDMKGGDLIGFCEVVVTPDMVGHPIALFTNIEVKTAHDVLKKGQIRFHNFVLEHGGKSEIWREKNGQIEIVDGPIVEPPGRG